MNARGIDFTGIAMLAGIGLVAYVGYRVAKGAPSVAEAVGDTVAAAGRAVSATVDAVNPVNPENVFNRAANSVTATLTGDPGMTPGLWIENLFKGNPGENDGSKLLDYFSTIDQEDADQGAAGRQLAQHMERRPDLYLWPADVEDAELGAAMAASTGAAFVDYSKLRRGVFK